MCLYKQIRTHTGPRWRPRSTESRSQSRHNARLSAQDICVLQKRSPTAFTCVNMLSGSRPAPFVLVASKLTLAATPALSTSSRLWLWWRKANICLSSPLSAYSCVDRRVTTDGGQLQRFSRNWRVIHVRSRSLVKRVVASRRVASRDRRKRLAKRRFVSI